MHFSKLAPFLFVSILAACQTTAADAPATDDAPTDETGDTSSKGSSKKKGKSKSETELPGEKSGECRLETSWDGPVTTTCSAAAGACIGNAKTGSQVSACITGEANCAKCFDEVVRGCLVGSPGAPGVCAEKAGCVETCITDECGAKPTTACTSKALAGACKDRSAELQACLDSADQTPCMARFKNECVPKASCGNNTVEKGETCDGNCPTSCPLPAAGDLCTVSTLKGNAATCSAVCETQSVCPAQCPSNAGPISTVGVIASGTALPASPVAAWPALGSLHATGCPSVLSADSNVVAWRAPAANQYTFSAKCSITWTSYGLGTGTKYENQLDCVSRVAIARGAQCAAGVDPFACALDVGNAYQQSLYPDKKALAPVDLASGDTILVAASFGLRTALPPEKTNYSYGGHISAVSWSVSATTCAPQCSGKACGADGCGGTCGTCSTGETCTASGTCKAACVPACTGKTCGPDGCGGVCGTCATGQTCTGGTCKAACIPSCSGKTCGSDGCGGTCGSCTGAKTCIAGQCQLSGECDPVSNIGCTTPNQCITLANETNQCVLMGSGTQGSSCADSTGCKGGYGCFAGTCRKICDRVTGSGCITGTCANVNGWNKYGACQ